MKVINWMNPERGSWNVGQLKGKSGEDRDELWMRRVKVSESMQIRTERMRAFKVH